MNKKIVLLCLGLTGLLVYPAEVKTDAEQPGLRQLVKALQELDAVEVQNIIQKYPNLDLNQLNPVSGEEGSTEGSHTSPLVMIPFYSYANRYKQHESRQVGAVSHPDVKLFRVIEKLADAGVNFDVVDDFTDGVQHMHHLWWQNTPLTSCVRRNNSDALAIARVMLAQGKANANLPDSRGQTPLYLACKMRSIEGVELLLNHNADIDRQVDLKMVDKHGDTPLITAARKRHSQVIDHLIGCGADVNKTNAYGANALMHFVNSRRDDNESAETLETLATLIAATRDINAQTTEADVGGGIREGESALTLAASYRTAVGNSRTIDTLLKDPRITLPDSSILVQGSDERQRWEERCAEIPFKHILDAVRNKLDAPKVAEEQVEQASQ